MAEAEAPARYTATGKKIRKTVLGRKVGMTQIFDENGRWVPVTVLEVGPCTVLQVKTIEKDGYNAVQLGFGTRRKSRVKKPQAELFAKLGVDAVHFIREVPFVDVADLQSGPESKGAEPKGPESKGPESEGPESKDAGEKGDAAAGAGPKPGDRIGATVFASTKRVDVGGVSKGRGFAGVIRRYHFHAGPKSHGTKNIREPGSTGMHTDPGRVLKGKRMPGHLGAANCKARNLRVVKIEAETNLLLVEGGVPGPNGAFVFVEESLRQK